MPLWLVALLAYSALALPSALLLVAALSVSAASDFPTNPSPTAQRLPRTLEAAPLEQA